MKEGRIWGRAKVLQRASSRLRFMDSARSHLKDYIEQTITNRPFFSRWDWFNSLPYPLWYRFFRHPRLNPSACKRPRGKVRTALWWRCVAKLPCCSFILWASPNVDIDWDSLFLPKTNKEEKGENLAFIWLFREIQILILFDIIFFYK